MMMLLTSLMSLMLGAGDGLYVEGEKLNVDVQKVELRSRDNGNTRFLLSVDIPYRQEARPTLRLLEHLECQDRVRR